MHIECIGYGQGYYLSSYADHATLGFGSWVGDEIDRPTVEGMVLFIVNQYLGGIYQL